MVHQAEGALLAAISASRAEAPPAEPHPQYAEGCESADRVEQGIVRRSGAAGDERLVNLIQDGVSCGAEECRQAPRPAPPLAVTAHPAIEQQAKHKIFREVRALSNEIVDRPELILCKRRNQPPQNRFEHPRRVLRGERVRGCREDDPCPEEYWPPDVQPKWHAGRPQAGLNL